uniref:Uncharacterized protein n=1 Tax=viral metagenome TaxID=1070528 RepID=A0A6M3L5G9_9ZZZZ
MCDEKILGVASSDVIGINPDDFLKILNEFGKAFCLILDFLPSKELSFPVPVKDGCTLLFTVKKS